MPRSRRSGTKSGTLIRGIFDKETRQELKAPLLTTVEGPGRLQIKPNIRALTLDVVERPKARGDIEYAQPNFIHSRIGTMG